MHQKLAQTMIDGEPEDSEALAKEAKFIEEIGKRYTFCTPLTISRPISFSIQPTFIPAILQHNNFVMFKIITQKARNAKAFQILFDISEKTNYTEIHIQNPGSFNNILGLVH